MEGGGGGHTIQQSLPKTGTEKGSGAGTAPSPPFPIFSRCAREATGSSGGGRGVCLDFDSKTRDFTSYIQCLPGEGAPDDTVLYKSLNSESQVTKHCVTEVGVRPQLGS